MEVRDGGVLMGFLDGVWNNVIGIFRDDKDELIFFIIVFLFLLFGDKSGRLADGGDDDFMIVFILLFLIFFAQSFESRIDENLDQPVF